ncbi:MAG: hypothetical protein GX771_06460 [Halomonadaceae bacterium]|nr:hypothetical protein [Halomonadaceae bacterium]
MYASRLKLLLAAWMMVPTVTLASEGNPFVAQQGAGVPGQLERRLEQLESLARDTESKVDDLASQFPGIAVSEFREDAQGSLPSRALTSSDVVIGTVNGLCLVKRSWGHGGTTLESLDLKGPCINQGDPAMSQQSDVKPAH